MIFEKILFKYSMKIKILTINMKFFDVNLNKIT